MFTCQPCILKLTFTCSYVITDELQVAKLTCKHGNTANYRVLLCNFPASGKHLALFQPLLPETLSFGGSAEGKRLALQTGFRRREGHVEPRRTLRGTRQHVRSPPGVRGAHCNQQRSTACVWSARPLIWTATRGSRASWPQVSLPASDSKASGENGGEGVSSVSTESATEDQRHF